MAQSRHKSEIERDRRNIAKLYLSGTTQMDIAEKLKISQATVSRDLKVIEKEWAAARINDIDERKRMELAKIDNLELVYWEGGRRARRMPRSKPSRCRVTQTSRARLKRPGASKDRLGIRDSCRASRGVLISGANCSD